MKQHLRNGIALLLGLIAIPGAARHPGFVPPVKNDPGRSILIARTEAALVDQIKCQKPPQVARAIDTMLENRLIRYVDNESGVYLYSPTVPLHFLGLRVTSISGFDVHDAFKHVPASRMVGTAPPFFIEVNVAASAGELRKRALDAGLIEAVPYRNQKRGFWVDAKGLGAYLAPRSREVTSSIECVYSDFQG